MLWDITLDAEIYIFPSPMLWPINFRPKTHFIWHSGRSTDFVWFTNLSILYEGIFIEVRVETKGMNGWMEGLHILRLSSTTCGPSTDSLTQSTWPTYMEKLPESGKITNLWIKFFFFLVIEVISIFGQINNVIVFDVTYIDIHVLLITRVLLHCTLYSSC